MAQRSPGRPVGSADEATDPDQVTLELAHSPSKTMTTHELRRVQKGVTQNVKMVESRIAFFQREEEKIWRDLEEVRRQASKIEDGRARTIAKQAAARAIAQVKEQAVQENRVKAIKQKQELEERKKEAKVITAEERRIRGEEKRRESQDILRQKRLEDAQQRLARSERVVAMQREQLEAKLRQNQERTERLARFRENAELARVEAEQDVQQAESQLPALEEQEMKCLQRLQNSRIVTQTVLQELEASLGSTSPVASYLRGKHNRSSGVVKAGNESPAPPINGSPAGSAPLSA